MGFSDEARKLARQEQQARDKQDPDRPFIENTGRALRIREGDEQWRSNCRERVGQWFDRVGMRPRPPYRIGGIRLRPRPNSDLSEPYIEITWEFDGYKYIATCTENSESLPTVEINIKDYWLPAGTTKVAIGRAILREEWPDPSSAWASSIMESGGPLAQGVIPPPPQGVIPPPPQDC
jgi:hypothetical protein